LTQPEPLEIPYSAERLSPITKIVEFELADVIKEINRQNKPIAIAFFDTKVNRLF
jgi:hypothetical protein